MISFGNNDALFFNTNISLDSLGGAVEIEKKY